MVLTYFDVSVEKSVLYRIHSGCLIGDCVFSLRCDCGAQLRIALGSMGVNVSEPLHHHTEVKPYNEKCPAEKLSKLGHRE